MSQVIVAVVLLVAADRREIVAGVASLNNVTVALADFEPSAALVAVIVTGGCPFGIDAGAVYVPVLVNVPTDGSLDVQLTLGSGDPITVAVNCCV